MFKKLREKRLKKNYFAFYDLLEEPARSQAKENYGSMEIVRKVDTLSEALILGFFWDDSPEGNDYWKKIYFELIDKAKKNG